MSYLIANDYLKQIQNVQLQQLIAADSTIQTRAELAAVAEVRSYLVQKYDVDQELTDTATWSNAVTYKAGQRVVSGSDIYYAQYPKPVFNLYGIYKIDDEVFWGDHTYKCLIATKALDHTGLLQYGNTANVPPVNVFPDNDTLGTQYWQDLGAYTVPAATAVSNTVYWTKGDNRNQQVLMCMVDIVLYHLHSRIAPNNIPQLRQNRYDAAIDWLKMAANGDITADLPKLQPKSGARIRFGSNIKTQTNY